MSSEHLEGPVLTSSTQEDITSTPCAICRRQFSRYTCPKCNIPYCSLKCFRSQTHGECSEAFYKREIEHDIKTTPSKSAEERQKMMQLLKRFEEDSLDDDAVLEDAEDDLASRFEDLDINKASYDDLWSALTPAERDRFMAALRDPSSDLAQQLLASDQLETERVEPWWETPSDPPPDNTVGSNEIGPSIRKRRFGHPPEAMVVPPTLASSQAGNPLLYNTAALLIAYSFTTRSLSVSPLSSLSPQDPEFAEARKTLSRLVPFLTESRSKTVFPSLTACITDIWSRFEQGELTPALLSILLQDTSKLLRPSPVSLLSGGEEGERGLSQESAHPNFNTLLALSDISALFWLSSASVKGNHVTHKLTFYAGRVMSTPTVVMGVISEEVMIRAKVVGREGMEDEASARMTAQSKVDGSKGVVSSSSGPLIEELPSS